jgi:uncharacterized protein YjbI with pentapeptide repeats
MESPRQKTTKPKGLTGRSFKLDGKELSKALGKSILYLAQGKLEDVTSSALDAISAVGLGNEPAALAYVLMRRAATRAMFALVGETVKSTAFGVRPYESIIEDSLEYTIDDYETFIGPDFFDRPTELPVVKGLEEILSRWLTLLAIEPHVVTTIVERFPSYFLFSLNEEWRKSPKTYQPLLDSLDTPFAKASDREWAWRAYASWLRLQIDESSFDEAFSLRQIYVPLRAYYEDVAGREANTGPGRRGKVRTIIDLHTELLAWLQKEQRDDAVRVISGGPGSGKSSFAKIFAAHVAEIEHVRTLFIPLHLIDPTRDIEEEAGRFVADMLPYNPLAVESREPRLLLIFDGLDELASQGKAANETARLFIGAIEQLVNRRNLQGLRLQVLVSGRELIVQGNESEFRKPHQILTLLPYLLDEHSIGSEHLVRDPHNLRKQDQRHMWWRQYGQLTGQKYEGLPEPLHRHDLQEVTAQPLLNYLVALSYTRGKLDFDQDVNLNQVYEDLVLAVHERAYEKRRLYASIRNMDASEFIRILEEVGLAAWHGNGRTTTVREIAEHCKVSGLDELLGKFEEGAKVGVTRLLAAFFFRQHEHNASGDQTFIFTHKSFGEYLAARRIVRAMSRITTEREARANSPDSGWGEREALVHWAQTTSANPLTNYLVSFLVNELALKEAPHVRKVQLCFARLFSYVLKNGMPMEKMPPTTFQQQMLLSRNCEEALLVGMSQCALITEEISPIEHYNSTAFSNWYNRVHGQNPTLESTLTCKNLRLLNLSEIDLAFVNLSSADISYSNLCQTVLHYTILTFVDVTGVNFDKAFLQGVNMIEASFIDCSFKDCYFGRGIMDHTKFAQCDFANAKIESIDDLLRGEFIQTSLEQVTYKDKAGLRIQDAEHHKIGWEDEC